jgi:HEAT repeat protein
MWRALLAVLVALVAPLAADRFEELKTQLASSDARQRREAVVDLAKLNTLDAWKLVIGALKDTNSQVADEAQMQVASIADAAAMKELLGKDGLASKDDWVRVRVAEALGRMTNYPDNAVMLKLLTDKNADVRRTACWSIQRQCEHRLWNTTIPKELVDVVTKDKDAGTRAAAMVAVSRFSVEHDNNFEIDGESRRAAVDPAYEVRAAALLAHFTTREAGNPLEFYQGLDVAMKDAHVGVRLCAAEYLASDRWRGAALRLVDMLESEKQLRARWRIVELLRGMSGLAHRLDARPWREWAQALPENWQGESKPAPKFDDADKTVSFAGLPILSERVCFLIDLSGSVWQKNKDGKTRKSVIDDELKKALEALPPSTEFNVIPYTAAPIPWQPALVPADKKNVAKALEFFTSRKDTGTGNFWDAYLVALDDPKVDTIVMLSDGAPTGGHRWNLTLMRQLMAEHNRFRRVALDAVLADAKGRIVEEWRGMCADSGGHLVEVELR